MKITTDVKLKKSDIITPCTGIGEQLIVVKELENAYEVKFITNSAKKVMPDIIKSGAWKIIGREMFDTFGNYVLEPYEGPIEVKIL